MTTVFLVIAALGLAGAGFFLVITFSLLRVVGSQRRKIRQESKERHQVVEAIKEATRIASAYDAKRFGFPRDAGLFITTF